MSRTFEILGSVLRVETGEARLDGLLDVLYAPFPQCSGGDAAMTLRVEARSERDHFDLWAVRGDHEERLLDNKHFDRVVMNIAVQLNSAALYEAKLHTVHAGVVAGDGHAVAFPASSGDGKSTLAAACVAAGMEYVSDEALCMDWETGEVVPYPKPLWLSEWSRAELGLGGGSVLFESPRYEEALIAPAQLGWNVAAGRMRLAHVVEIDTEGTAAVLVPGSGRHAADALVRHTFWGNQAPRAFSVAARQARQTRFWRLSVADLDRAVAAVAELVANPSGL